MATYFNTYLMFLKTSEHVILIHIARIDTLKGPHLLFLVSLGQLFWGCV